MLFGFFCVMLPWLIRQERVYGIASLSDNIGEAIYAATSPIYKQWTPAVRKDADAAGIPNTVGDRYRYFIDRAVENVKTESWFLSSQCRGGALGICKYVRPAKPGHKPVRKLVFQRRSGPESASALFASLHVPRVVAGKKQALCSHLIYSFY